MHILNLYGIQIFRTLLSYRSWEILNQFAARKHSAEMRSRGSLSLMCILMQIILLKRNHIQMWLELCICIHPPWKQFECFPLETYVPQWQLHCRNVLKWLILTGHILDFTCWMAAGRPELPHSGWAVFNQALLGFRDKLHVWLQATLKSPRCTFVTP